MENTDQGFLHSYFLNNSGNSIHKWLHYFDVYEKHFRKYVNKPILMIEIGIDQGGSIGMWKKYFGDQCVIVGIDINPECKKFEDSPNSIFVEIGDQSDANFLQSVIEKYGNPDVVLDDGSHIMHHLIESFNFLYPLLKQDGTYLAEDLHTSYWPGWGGGFLKSDTFIEFTKSKIDELNAFHSMGTKEITEFTRNTQSISIYDSIAVFEKRKQGKKFDIRTGRY